MTNFQIGAQMYSVRDLTTNEGDMLSTLKAIKKMGYNTCQLSGHNQQIPAETIAGFLGETGMTCCATHISFEAMEAHFDDVVRTHRLWKCEYPGIGGLPAEYRENGSAGYVEFARRASAVADKLAAEGMHFIYHNHAFEFERFPDTGKTGLEILLENTSPNVQFELDVFWVQAGGGNPVEWIEKVRGRMDVVHFKEMNGSLKPPCMAPIGTGNLNWPKIMAACDSIQVKYALVEQDNAVETNSLNCMRVSHDNLLNLGGRF